VRLRVWEDAKVFAMQKTWVLLSPWVMMGGLGMLTFWIGWRRRRCWMGISMP